MRHPSSAILPCWRRHIPAVLCEHTRTDALPSRALLCQVEVVGCGDIVNELQVVLAGEALALRGSGSDTLLEEDGATSVHGGDTRLLGPGDTAGEMAFFTETPCMEVRPRAQPMPSPACLAACCCARCAVPSGSCCAHAACPLRRV